MSCFITFRLSNECLDEQLKHLKGLGRTVAHKEAITPDDYKKLYTSGVFDTSTPLSLLRKVIKPLINFCACLRRCTIILRQIPMCLLIDFLQQFFADKLALMIILLFRFGLKLRFTSVQKEESLKKKSRNPHSKFFLTNSDVAMWQER